MSGDMKAVTGAVQNSVVTAGGNIGGSAGRSVSNVGSGVVGVGSGIMAGDAGAAASAAISTAGNTVADYDQDVAAGLHGYSTVTENTINTALDSNLYDAMNVASYDGMDVTRSAFYGQGGPANAVSPTQRNQ